MPGSFIGFPRDPVTNEAVGLRHSRMPKLHLPSFLSRKSSEASTTSTTSTTSTSSSIRSSSSIVDIEKRDFLSSRPSSIDSPPAYEYPESQQPRHPSIMLSPMEAKAVAKAQEKARRRAERAVANEQARRELKEMDKIMRYAGMGPCSSRLH